MDCSAPGCPSLSPGVCSNSCPLSWCFHPTISSSAAPFSFRKTAHTSWGWSPDVQGCLGKRVLCPLDRHLRGYNQVYNFHITIHQKKSDEKRHHTPSSSQTSFDVATGLKWAGSHLISCNAYLLRWVPVSTRPRHKDIYLHGGRPSLGILSLGSVFRHSRDWKQCLSSSAVGNSRKNLLRCLFSSGKKQNIWNMDMFLCQFVP